MLEKKIQVIPVITLLRGLAALMVCLYHFICKTTGYIDNELVLSVFHYGGLGVPIFFVISGVVLPLAMQNGNYKTSSWKNFLKKRIIRIEPPYLMAVFLGIIYMHLRSFVPNTVDADLIPSFKNILLHIAYLVPFFEDARWLNGAFWTLAIEFQYYLLLILIFPLMISKKITYRIVFYTVLLIPGILFDSSEFFPHWASLFLIGILYILKKTNKISLVEYIMMSIISLSIIYSFLNFETMLAVIFTLAVIHYLPNFKLKGFQFLGKISYSLYLIHGLTGSALINILSHRYTEPYHKVIVVFAGLVFSVLAAYLMNLLVEKPSQKWAKSIGYNDQKG